MERSQKQRSRSPLAERASALHYSRVPEQTPVGCGEGRFGNLTGGFSSGSERAAPSHKLVRAGPSGGYAGAPPHGCAACIGGQTTAPYEQNTQQSPAAGLTSTPHVR